MTESISAATSGTDYLSMIQSATSSTSSSSSSSSTSMTTSEIVSELKQDATASTKTAQQIANEYNISLVKAQEVLDELNGTDETTDSNASTEYFSVDTDVPDDSTVSYHV
jgi:hypothetical protein